MIPSQSKFPLRTDFLRFRARAKRLVTPRSTIYHLPAQAGLRSTIDDPRSMIFSRLSVIIPKKLSKLATTRNWLKRLTYDTLYPLIIDKKIDCVVVYKPLPLKKSFVIKQQIIHELSQATNVL